MWKCWVVRPRECQMMTKPMIRSLFLCPFISGPWAAPLCDSGDSIFCSSEEDLAKVQRIPKDQTVSQLERDISYLWRQNWWMEWVRQSLGRSNGWLMVGLNNEATCNSGTDLSQNCHRIGEQPKRAKQLSFSATGSLQKCLKMHRHLLSHCRQANSHSFGRIKEIVPLLAKELGGCVVWQNCSNIYVVSKYCSSIYVVSIPTFHTTWRQLCCIL